MKHTPIFAAVFCGLLLLSATSRAQDLYVGSNAANVTTNFTSGTNAFYNTYVGYTTNATNNLLNVSGAGTVLTNTNDLHVGYLGSGNRLVISNGAQVFNHFTYIGYGVQAAMPWLYATNNSALVTGTNSRWTVSGLDVGFQGNASSLVISNGGQVSSYYSVRIGPYASGNSVLVSGAGSSLLASVKIGESSIEGLSYNNSLVVSNGGVITGTNASVTGGSYIGYSSSNNNVLITGSGSMWTEAGALSIGLFEDGTGNRLVISNGGAVTTAGGIIGVGGYTFQPPLPGNASNSVVVTGTNSSWTSTGQLVVGQNRDGSSLTISDGGSVICGTNLIINQYYPNTNGSSQAGSLVLVQSGRLSVTNGQINFGAGLGTLQVDGGTVEIKELRATTPITPAGQISPAERRGSFVLLNSGTIISGATTISNESGKADNRTFYIGGNSGSGATFVAKGGTHSFWANVAVGDAGSSNSLVITNGAEVFLRPRPDSNHGPSGGTNLVIGVAAGASNNSVRISSGRLVITNGTLEIGRAGSGALNVTGGTVEVKTLTATNGTNSVINLNGGTIISEGSAISNAASFVVGDTGSSATFIAKGGAHSFASNTVVGNSGSGNSLVISNGGVAASATGSVGHFAVSSNNNALVTGTNSLWTNSGVFRVGESGSGNSLVISNGGKVANTEGSIGYNGVSSNNSALVTGANSVWTNSGYFYAGAYGSGNRLIVSNGGTVAALISQIGTFGSSLNNSVLVTGTNSLFNNALYLFIGGSGNSGNSLVISNGGLVTVGIDSRIGGDVAADNNSVLVTGAGSRWSNAFSLFVGTAGVSNSLTVANGGNASAGSGLTIAASNGSVATLNIGRFGTNDTAGTITAPTIAFGAGTGVLNFNQSDATTITAAISGNGALKQLGTGATTLSGSNNYSGGTWIGAGTLQLDHANAAGSGAITQSNEGSTLQINTTGTVTNAMSLYNIATLQTVTLSGAKTLNGATYNVAADTTTTESGVLSGAGGLTKSGTGTMILSASNTHTGSTTVGSGVLALTNGSAIADTAVVTNSGATLRVDSSETIGSLRGSGSTVLNGAAVTLTVAETNSHTYAGVISGAGGFAKIGGGTTTLSASNSFSGPLNVQAGTLDLAATGGSAAPLVAAGGDSGAAVILQTKNYYNVNGSTYGSGSQLYWDKFDTSLGTLTGVIMEFFGNLTGSFSVQNLELETPIDVYNSTSTFRLNFDAGFAGAPSDITGTAVSPIGTTPGTGASPGTTIAGSGSQTFSIDSPVTLYNSGPVDYFANASYFSSVGAANFYTILFRELQATVDGSPFYSADYSGAAMSGTISLTYGYTPTPAPEPGTGGGAAASVTSISVNNGATLLVSQSHQVNDSAPVTLSGGTIRRGGNVGEVFGNLNLTEASFLDYGAANDAGTIRFGTYAPSALLTVQNFLPGNKLQFGNTISSTDLNNTSLFRFSNGFTTGTESGFFTITAIPEPSTYIAALGLLAVLLWPLRRKPPELSNRR